MKNTSVSTTLATSFGTLSLRCDTPFDWSFSLESLPAEEGVAVVRIALESPEPAPPPRFSIGSDLPLVGAAYQWRLNESATALRPEWGGYASSDLAVNLPLYAYFDGNDTCHLSIAVSECGREVAFRGGVREEGCRLAFQFTFFAIPEAPLTRYETFLRFDLRPQPLWEAIPQAIAWMHETAGYVPCPVPDAAFDPLYSSWYNFHQDVHAADLEAEFALAADLGMRTLIVDDGWQTDDTNRGYAFCGDWQVSPNRIPDMRAHVARAHALGLKYMLWYSVPYMGLKSRNHARFEGKFLNPNDRNMGTSVLDPRFPEVRRFLVETYAAALREWDLDGFKLDFIDAFRYPNGIDPAIAENYAGRDIQTVPAAVDRLMKEVRAALTAIKPGILIEFRQRYNGPAIRQYGNLFRVGDCPGDFLSNRVAIANMRLALHGAAIHSDMLEWNTAETPERAALYILNSLFGVVQYSLMLREVPPRHLDLIRHWIAFSQTHRDTLLHGAFRPRHPELQYPLIEAESPAERIVGVYGDGIVAPVVLDKPVFVLNATGTASLLVETDTPADIRLFDTFGAEAGAVRLETAGLHRLACPVSGYAMIDTTSSKE